MFRTTGRDNGFVGSTMGVTAGAGATGTVNGTAAGSQDERYSTAPDEGRSQTRASGATGKMATATPAAAVAVSVGGTAVGVGPSHFDTEMEANRLAYVRHLQVDYFVPLGILCSSHGRDGRRYTALA